MTRPHHYLRKDCRGVFIIGSADYALFLIKLEVIIAKTLGI